MSIKFMANFIAPVLCAVAALVLSGCGLDDIQMNGKVFDALGVNTASAPKKTPQLAERAPLVVPPSLDKLPEPGAPAAAPSGNGLADIQDYDTKRQTSHADIERQQAEYCKKHYTDAKILGDQDAEQAAGPLGPCHGSAFGAITKWTSGGDGEK